MLDQVRALPTKERVIVLAKIMSTAHRLMDGKPGQLILDGKLTRYAHVLPDENGKEPRLFKVCLDTEIERGLARWAQESPSNYRALHDLMSYSMVEYEDDNNGALHPLQRMGFGTSLWTTPNAMAYAHAQMEKTPLPSKRVIRPRGEATKRIIRDR